MKHDILKQIFRTKLKVSLEEVATGVGAPEVEHVVYGRLTDLTQLSRATHMEKQEQWEIKIPKTDENANRGTVRVRKTMVEGKPIKFTACVKTPAGDPSNPIKRDEVVIPCTEDFFEVLKTMAGRGMFKHRYFFPVNSAGEVVPDSVGNQPDITTDEQPDLTTTAEVTPPVEEVNDQGQEPGDTPAEDVDATEQTDGEEAVSTEGDTVDMLEAGTGTPTTPQEIAQLTGGDVDAAAPQRFVKEQVEVDAIKWTGKNIAEVQAFLDQNADTDGTIEISEDDGSDDGELLIDTLEDGENQQVQHIASAGDWIIRGVAGEYYPCKPEIFAETYRLADKVSVEDLEAQADPAGVDTSEVQLDANAVSSPESAPAGGLVWELDLFLKPDGTYYDWIKMDLEVGEGNENAPLPPFPIELSDIISAPYGSRTPEEEAIVSKLYDTIFATRNPGAVPVAQAPTPEFEETKLVEDGTPADGTPADSDGVGTPSTEDDNTSTASSTASTAPTGDEGSTGGSTASSPEDGSSGDSGGSTGSSSTASAPASNSQGGGGSTASQPQS